MELRAGRSRVRLGPSPLLWEPPRNINHEQNQGLFRIGSSERARPEYGLDADRRWGANWHTGGLFRNPGAIPELRWIWEVCSHRSLGRDRRFGFKRRGGQR